MELLQLVILRFERSETRMKSGTMRNRNEFHLQISGVFQMMKSEAMMRLFFGREFVFF